VATVGARWCALPPTTMRCLSSQPLKRMRTVLEAWADRTAALSELDGVQQVFCFRESWRRDRSDAGPSTRADLRPPLHQPRRPARRSALPRSTESAPAATCSATS
jgi:hypothetical protein